MGESAQGEAVQAVDLIEDTRRKLETARHMAELMRAGHQRSADAIMAPVHAKEAEVAHLEEELRLLEEAATDGIAIYESQLSEITDTAEA